MVADVDELDAAMGYKEEVVTYFCKVCGSKCRAFAHTQAIRTL